MYWKHFELLVDDEKLYGYNATARNSVSSLRELFSDRIIRTGFWPLRSPDLSVYDFHLWENLKRKVYRNTPRTAEALQNETRKVVTPISADELQSISHGFLRRFECV
jgi:hypothetical protein